MAGWRHGGKSRQAKSEGATGHPIRASARTKDDVCDDDKVAVMQAPTCESSTLKRVGINAIKTETDEKDETSSGGGSSSSSNSSDIEPEVKPAETTSYVYSSVKLPLMSNSPLQRVMCISNLSRRGSSHSMPPSRTSNSTLLIV